MSLVKSAPVFFVSTAIVRLGTSMRQNKKVQTPMPITPATIRTTRLPSFPAEINWRNLSAAFPESESSKSLNWLDTVGTFELADRYLSHRNGAAKASTSGRAVVKKSTFDPAKVDSLDRRAGFSASAIIATPVQPGGALGDAGVKCRSLKPSQTKP